MPRTIRIAGSFAIVLVAYWTYSLIAVPLIEPSVDPNQRKKVSQQRIEHARENQDRRVSELEGLFAPGSWELEDPNILESDQVKLLLQEYTTQNDGTVKLCPCTIIFTPHGSAATPHERRRAAVILQAPQGALLEFDEPLDLSRAKIGRLVSGRLLGQITIRSAGKSPKPTDDLVILARNVQLTEDHIWTPDPIQFRLGQHFGRGRELHIGLLRGDDEGSGKRKRHGPNIAGLKSFELRHVDRLHLQFPSSKLPADAQRRRADPRRAPRVDVQIEITCRGPFRFDAIEQVASFEDQVNVVRIHPDGPSDQLDCQLLLVYFDAKPAAGPAEADPETPDPKEQPGISQLQPRRLEARGNPVVVRSPREKLEAQGQRLQYDLSTGRIVLDGSRQVFLKQGSNEIHAGSLQYQVAEPGRMLGQVVAKGPGWLRGQMSDRPEAQLEARWTEQLLVRPDEQNQLISLSGGAAVEFRGIGKLTADEIHFWLNELPGGKADRPELQPDRVLAERNVEIESPQLTGAVDQLRVWFEQDKNAPGGYRASIKQSGGSGQSTSPKGTVPRASGGPLGGGPLGSGSLGGGLAPGAARRHFQITARLLQAEVTVSEKQVELSELTIEGDVRLIETRTARVDQQPLVVRGDWLRVEEASKPHAAVRVTGRAAHFEGGGLGLTGSNINLNGGTNRLWIDGPGTMDLPPLGRDLQGRTIPNAKPMKVSWQHGMEFDGRTARFQESVVADAEHQQLRTETLEAVFQQPIRFAELEDQPQPEIEQIRCLGGVLMENRSFDANRQTAIEHVQVGNLLINNLSGAIEAKGPGRVTTVRYGSSDPAALPGAIVGSGQNSTAQSSPKDSKPERLVYLNVSFQGSITGNLRQRTITFHDQVRTVYGPVDSWQSTLPADDPDALGPDGALLRCDHLSVTEMTTPDGNRRAVELEAVGNTRVEGRDFTAQAARMTYDQSKDLLVLEGDGRTDAALYLQRHVGGATNEFLAEKIRYWPRTKRLSVAGGRSLQGHMGVRTGSGLQ